MQTRVKREQPRYWVLSRSVYLLFLSYLEKPGNRIFHKRSRDKSTPYWSTTGRNTQVNQDSWPGSLTDTFKNTQSGVCSSHAFVKDPPDLLMKENIDPRRVDPNLADDFLRFYPVEASTEVSSISSSCFSEYKCGLWRLSLNSIRPSKVHQVRREMSRHYLKWTGLLWTSFCHCGLTTEG